VRLWFFLQDLATLEEKYPTTWKSFLQVETKTFFGTDDPMTAGMISGYLGDHTVAYGLPNMSASTTGGASPSAGYSISENLNLAGRRLLTPDEVTGLLRGTAQGRKAIHFLRDLKHPLQTDLFPWFQNDTLRARV
jgi:type IV secretion system protein VirD4